MDLGIIITAILGIISSFISAWTSWFFARKKYNSEVDNNLISNMLNSLEFYKKLSDDNRERLEEVLKRNDLLEQLVESLRKLVFSLMTSICTDLTCLMRKHDLNLFNENSSRLKMEEA